MIGSGNVATNLAIALKDSKWNVIQVYSRNRNSARQLAEMVSANYIDSLKEINPNADLYIISVPDKSIAQVFNEIPELKGYLVHTSGSTDISVLTPSKSKGYGVFYPFQTFTKSRIISFENLPICIEANDQETFNFLNQVGLSLSTSVHKMDSNTRSWLHLTGVFTNNFTNHLLTLSQKISEGKGFDFSLIRPLALETIQKAFEIGPTNAQTGPAARFDEETIKLHIEKIKDYSPELADIYKALTLSIQSSLKKNN